MILFLQASRDGSEAWKLKKAARILLGAFAWLAGALAEPQTGLAAEPPAAVPAILTNALQVLNLSRLEAEQNIPVRVRGVVTYADAAWGLWFMQDATAGIFLHRTNRSPVLAAGDQVEVQGVSQLGGFAPIIAAQTLTIGGQSPLPEAKFFTFDELASGGHDSQWVETEAIVRAVYVTAGNLVFELGGAHNFQTFMPELTNTPPTQLVEARVRVRGVWASVFNGRGQLSGYQLFCPGLDQIRVVAPARAEPFASPAKAMATVLGFHSAKDFGHRIKVAGVVTGFEPGGIFYVQDDSSGLRVHTRDPLELHPGDRLEAVGFPEVGGTAPKLVEAVIRRLGTEVLPTPELVGLVKGFAADWDARLIKLEGRLVEKDLRPGEAKLVLKANQMFFEARLAGTNAFRELNQFLPGSWLALTGVGSIQLDSNLLPVALALSLRSARDVEILRPPPWWTIPRALGLAGLTTLGLLGWRLAGLRREARLKEQYRVLFENASDLICTQTLAGGFNQLNAAWTKLTGYALTDLQRMSLSELIVPEQRPAFEIWWRQIAAGEPAAPPQFEVIVAAGRRVWLEISSQRLDRPRGQRQIETIARDITGRKRAEAALREKDQLLRKVIDLVPHFIFAKDRHSRFLFANSAAAEAVGLTPEQLVGLSDFDLPRAREQAEAFMRDDQEVIASGKPKFVPEEFLTDAAGQVRVHQTIKIPFPAPGTGEPALLGVAVDITERKQSEHLLCVQKELLEAITAGQPLPATLQSICRVAEAESPGMLCSITLLDPDGVHLRHGAAGSLPEKFCRTIDGVPIGPAVGSCGTAAFRRVPVIVVDIETDPLWDICRHVAAPEKLRACWSTPIIGSDGVVLGTFANYYRAPRAPEPKHQQLIEMFTHIAAIALQRERAEKALRASEEKYRLIVDNVAETVLVLDLELRHVYASPSVFKLYGYTPEEFIQLPLEQVLTTESLQAALRLFDGEMALEAAGTADPTRSRVLESLEIRKDGVTICVENTFSFIRDGSARPIRILCVAKDTTERKEAEIALRRSQEHFQSLFDSSPLATTLTALADGRFLDVSQRFLELGEFTRAEVVGHTADEIALWCDPAQRDRLVARAREERVVRNFEARLRSKSGREIDLLISAQVIELPAGPALMVQGKDITERKRAELALRQSEERFSSVFRASPASIAITTWEEGHFVDVNAAFTQLLGYTREEALGRTALELGVWERPEQRANILERLRRGERVHGQECVYRTKARELRWALAAVDVIDLGNQRGLIFISHDITDRKQAEARQAALEAQLRQAQKLEAIGTLAGGIAHDFNNILGAILGRAELARMELPAEHQTQESVTEILKACLRARDLVRQILSFSRQQPQERKLVEIGPIILEALKLLRASLPTTIQIQTEIPPQSAPVLADPSQVHQTIMNLGANAGHAMRREGGRISVSQTLLTFDAAESARPGNLPPGKYVRITVADTGHGMDAATQERIFEPFFTTKATGEGTGLGLAVVHGIMRNHNGAITVESQPGAGTTFHLYFPVLDTVIPAGEATASPLPRGRREHILVVDDEVALGQLARRALEKMNYQVTICGGGKEALAAFRAAPDQFALVLTDLTMPEITGLKLAEELLQHRPGLPIILASGYTGALNQANARELGVSAFLSKPFELETLAQTVRRVLDGAN